MWWRIVFTGSVVLLLTAAAVVAQSGEDLFRQCRYKDVLNSDIPGAIQLCERVVREFSANRPLLARARLALGRLYEQREPEKALEHYRQVAAMADQADMAADARNRLAALSSISAAPLHIVDIDPVSRRARGSAKRLSPGTAWDQGLAWSPDSTMLAFKRRSPTRASQGFTYNLIVRTLAAGTERIIARDVAGDTPLWFHDNKSLLQYDSATRSFRRLDLKTGESTEALRLDFLPANEFNTNLSALSPDDRNLYVVHAIDNPIPNLAQQIVVFDLASGNRRRAFGMPGFGPIISRLILSPDGQTLAFIRATTTATATIAAANSISALAGIQGASTRLVRVGVNGRSYAEIYSGAPIANISWSRDSHGIFFAGLLSNRSAHIALLPAVGGQPFSAGLEVRDFGGFDLSRDGKRFAFSGSAHQVVVNPTASSALMNRLSSSVDLTPVSNSETVGITTPEAVTISGTTTTDNNLMAPRFPVTFMRVAEPGTNTAADTPITVYGPSISVSLEAGEYRVLPTSPAGFLLKSITSGSADLRSQPLKVSVNDPPQISIALNAVPQLMRKIGGRVIGHAKRIGSGPTLGISGTTNARTPILLDGSFEFSGVPPGTYTITPVPMAPGVALVGLTVVDTDVLNVEILLPATRDVVGRVFIEGDAPMPTSIAVVIPSGVANPSIQPSSNPPPPGSIGWQYAPPMPGSIVAPISTIMTVGLAVQRDGFFRIALPEGQRRISLMPASIPAGYSVKALTYGSIDLLTDAIKVDLADSEELRVILNTNGFRPGDR